MTTQIFPVDTAVNNLLRMIQAQLGNVQSLIDNQWSKNQTSEAA